MKSYVVLVVMSLFLFGCNGSSSDGYSNVDVRLRAYARGPGVSIISDHVLLVYLDAANGDVIRKSDVSNVGVWKRVRVMLQVGEIPKTYTSVSSNDRTVNEGSGYVRVYPVGKSYPEGILHFVNPRNRSIYAWQVNGADDGSGRYIGFDRMENGLFLEYAYSAQDHDDHSRINDFVERWYAANGRQPVNRK